MSRVYIGKKVVSNINEVMDDINAADVPLVSGVSFLIRAKNEEDNVYDCITGICDLGCDIIFVDNCSSDATLKIATELENKYPNLHVYQYNITVPKVGEEHKVAVANGSDNTLATYYNWCLSKVTTYNLIKWDADFIPIKNNLKQMLNKYAVCSRSDMFALWFTGKTLFYNKYVRESDYYNEYRIFSKLHGFKWKNFKSYETSHFYVNNPNCKKIIYSPTDSVISINVNPVKLQKLSCPVFFEKKNKKDIKNLSSCVDSRDANDNKTLQKYIHQINTQLIWDKSDSRIALLYSSSGCSDDCMNWVNSIYKQCLNLGFSISIIDTDLENLWFNNLLNSKMNYIFVSNANISSSQVNLLKDTSKLIRLEYSTNHIQDGCSKIVNPFVKNSGNLRLPQIFTNIKYYEKKVVTRKIGIISDLDISRNIIMAIYAIKKLINKKKLDGYELNIISDNQRGLNILKYYARRLKLGKHIIFHNCSKDKYVKFIMMCDFLLFPSVDNDPDVTSLIIKSCIMGTPVIGSTNGIDESIIGKHGLFLWLNKKTNDVANFNKREILDNIGYIIEKNELNGYPVITPPETTTKSEYNHNQRLLFNKNVNLISFTIENMIKNYKNYFNKRDEMSRHYCSLFGSEKRFINSLLRIVDENGLEFI